MGTHGRGDVAGRWYERLEGGRLLAALGLTGFAVSQPLLSVAGENPTLFTFAGVRGAGVVAFALVVGLLPALVVWALPTGIGLVSRGAGRAVFVLLAGALAGAAIVQFVKQAGIGRTSVLVLVGVAAAIGFALALLRWRWVDQWVRYTSPLPVIAVLAFLFASPSGQLVQAPSSGPAHAADRGPTAPVVVIMLDELPTRSLLTTSGDIDAVRFPNLAALGEQGTWYRNYTVMAHSTLESVPSILSGRVPRAAPPLWTAHPDTIFSLLAPTHDLNVYEPVTQLCGFEECEATAGGAGGGLWSVLGEIADVWTDRVAPRPTSPPDLGQFREEVVPLGETADRAEMVNLTDAEDVRARPDRVTAFLDAIDAGAGPAFHYLHLLLPHQPWMHHPSGDVYRSPGLAPEQIAQYHVAPGGLEWRVAVTKQKHLLQAQYTDRLVGEVLDRLRATGVYDDALVIVTADHGISFRDGVSRRVVDDVTRQDVAFVPLLVKSPGQRSGRVDDTNLWGVDLVPLVASELGLEVPWEVDGHAPTSPELAERGSRKEFYLFGTGFGPQPLEGIDDFDDSIRPTGANNLLGDLAEGDSPIAGLVATLGVADLLGQGLDDLDLDAAVSGAALVDELDALIRPPSDKAVLGSIWGRLEVPDTEGVVVVEVNGSIVTAAPIDDTAELNALLPPGVPDPDDNEVRMAVIPDGESAPAYEIAVVGSESG